MKNRVPKENIFTCLEASGQGIRNISDILLPPGFKITSSPNGLFNILSNSIKLKIILELELRFIKLL